jgi:hypothetical protein
MDIFPFYDPTIGFLVFFIFFQHIFHLHTQFHLIIFFLQYIIEFKEEFLLGVLMLFIHFDVLLSSYFYDYHFFLTFFHGILMKLINLLQFPNLIFYFFIVFVDL